MADKVDRVIATYRTDATITNGLYPDEEAQATFAADELEPVAAELRQSCAGCSQYVAPEFCRLFTALIPRDGTGYCHNWAAKEATNG